jgi:carbon storage regulator CsrA
MLVLTRKPQEQIRLGNNVTITVVRIQGNTVRLGIEAPHDVRVIRGEIADEQLDPSTEPVEKAIIADAGRKTAQGEIAAESHVLPRRPATGKAKSRPALRVRGKREASSLNAV